jgi:1,2-dihydroxy-3-keto-5-methylthiopentene dioxygenase
MAYLLISPDNAPEVTLAHHTHHEAIAGSLAPLGIRYERWLAETPLSPSATDAEILQTYAADCQRITLEGGYQSMDVVRITPDHPNKVVLRQQYLAEHTHMDDEVRFFVEGCGLFYLHCHSNVYRLLCDQGTLLCLPAGLKHWFDMGENPYFIAIRLFVSPEGWVGHFTGDPIAQHFAPYQPHLMTH